MKKGFTLVEIMIVVAIIALLAALTIPNLLRQRLNANEAAALHTLQTIAASEVSFRTTNALYGTLVNLGTAVPPYIDPTVYAAGGLQGYLFAQGEAPTATSFSINATPVTLNQTGSRSFCVTDDGVVRATAAGVGVVGNRAACQALNPA